MSFAKLCRAFNHWAISPNPLWYVWPREKIETDVVIVQLLESSRFDTRFHLQELESVGLTLIIYTHVHDKWDIFSVYVASVFYHAVQF